ncbi:MAG TPA: hypothetical protein VLD57_03350, partial [Blastocatellia bacterium]|nr:hypothetical protein [Blastocatellia bacterium]
MKCPGFERLIDYLDGRLAEDKAGLVASHLSAGCPNCEAGRQWYERVRQIAASDDTTEPPAWVLKRAIRLFEGRLRGESPASRLVGAIASLVFDSFARPVLAGVRSTETANRQLLYHADDYSIDLQVAASDKPHADLIGQLLRKDDLRFESVSGLSLHLIREGKTLRSTVTNNNGEFVLDRIESGEYDLIIETPDQSITVSGVP